MSSFYKNSTIGDIKSIVVPQLLRYRTLYITGSCHPFPSALLAVDKAFVAFIESGIYDVVAMSMRVNPAVVKRVSDRLLITAEEASSLVSNYITQACVMREYNALVAADDHGALLSVLILRATAQIKVLDLAGMALPCFH